MKLDDFSARLFEKAKAAGIEEFELYYTEGDSFDVDVLEGAIHEYSVSSSMGACFRGLYAGHMGYASTEVMDEDAIDLLIEGVKNNATLLEKDTNETIFEGSASYPEVKLYNEAIDAISSAQKISSAKEMEVVTKAQDKRVMRVDGCGFTTGSSCTRILNSKGLDISKKSNLIGAFVAPIVQEDGKVNYGVGMKFSRDPKDIDIKELAEKGVTKAVAGLGAQSVPSGSYNIVFRNDMAITLLSTFAGVFSGESARKGMSLLRGREGEKIAADCVTLTDDPLMEGGLASTPFDCEGVACFTKDIIKDGVLQTLLHNRMTAAAMGKTTTGNAAKAGYAGSVVVAPTNFFVKPSDKSFDTMLSEVGDGILITYLMGMHSGANAISGDFSLGAKGFMIEGGKITRPVEQITVAGNFFEVLKNIVSVADDLDFGHPGMSCIGSPAIFAGKMSVAGL